MKTGRRTWPIALLASSLLVVPCASAQDDVPDPETTRKVLSMVLAASNEPLPGGSACLGNFGQHGKPLVRDLLSMQLAYVYHGESVIRGACDSLRADRCTLSINRSFGDDVSSLTLAFNVRGEKLVASSLRCTSTP